MSAGTDGEAPATATTEAAPAAADADRTATEVERISRELRLARAADLARAGHRDQAARLLTEHDDEPTAAELDLLARIHAQRGDLTEADRLWERAGEAGGDASAYRAQRDRVAALRRRNTPGSRLRRGLLALLAVLAVLAALVWGFTRGNSGPDDGELAALRAQQDQIARDLSALRNAPPPAQPGATLPANLAPGLRAAGLDVRPRGNGLLVTFPQAPFPPQAVTVDARGDQLLTELGRRIAPLGRNVTVRVVGHAASDGTPARPGAEGADVGLQRAQEAARILQAAGVPSGGVTVVSAGLADPPFPGGDQGRNRTVTVELDPAG